MTPVHLYYHPFSNCAARVLLYLEEKGIAYEKTKIDLVASEQLQDWFLKINPKGRVPAITYNGEHYAESCDILRFLEQEFPEPSLTPEDDDLKVRMNEFVDIAKYSHDTIKDWMYSVNVGRLPTDQELKLYDQQDPENGDFHHRRRAGLVGCDVAKSATRIRQEFAPLEQALAQQHSAGKEYLLGELTLADLACFPNTTAYRLGGFDFSEMPHVSRWIKQMESRPAYRRTIGREIKWTPFSLARLFMRAKRIFQPERY